MLLFFAPPRQKTETGVAKPYKMSHLHIQYTPNNNLCIQFNTGVGMSSQNGRYTAFWSDLEMTGDYNKFVPYIDELLAKTDARALEGVFTTTWSYDGMPYMVEWDTSISGLQMELTPLL